MEETISPPNLPHPHLALGYRSQKIFTSKTERLEHALKIIASVIADDGDDYLPLFERLEGELEMARRREEALRRARHLGRIAQRSSHVLAYNLSHIFRIATGGRDKESSFINMLV